MTDKQVVLLLTIAETLVESHAVFGHLRPKLRDAMRAVTEEQWALVTARTSRPIALLDGDVTAS